MSKTNTWESDLLKLVFNNTTASLIGDATGIVGSTADGSLYVSLHTSSPGETGDQTTNEANYLSYTRIAVPRNTGNWLVSGTAPTQVTNVNTITFPECTGNPNTITHVGIGTALSGTGKLLYYGTLSGSINVSSGIVPLFDASTLIIEED